MFTDVGIITFASIMTIGLVVVAQGSVKKMPIISRNMRFVGGVLAKVYFLVLVAMIWSCHLLFR